MGEVEAVGPLDGMLACTPSQEVVAGEGKHYPAPNSHPKRPYHGQRAVQKEPQGHQDTPK